MDESDCFAASRWRTKTSTGTWPASISGETGSWYETGRERGSADDAGLDVAMVVVR